MGEGITSLLKKFRTGTKPKTAMAYIIPLNTHGDNIIAEKDSRSFQYFPQTISDTKASNYQAKTIPGLSHPLYQWTSGGAREISFQAVFSRDRTLTKQELDQIQTPGDIATKGRTLKVADSSDDRNVDIPSAIAYLRSYMDPEYSETDEGNTTTVVSRPYPPRRMILTLPGVRVNLGVPELTSSDMYCIMTNCDVVYDSFFPDGTPRMAKVSLTFAEIIQSGGNINPHDARNRRVMGLAGYTTNYKNSRDT